MTITDEEKEILKKINAVFLKKYRQAKGNSTIRNPAAWAAYKTWRYIDDLWGETENGSHKVVPKEKEEI